MGNCSGKPVDAIHPRDAAGDAPQEAPVEEVIVGTDMDTSNNAEKKVAVQEEAVKEKAVERPVQAKEESVSLRPTVAAVEAPTAPEPPTNGEAEPTQDFVDENPTEADEHAYLQQEELLRYQQFAKELFGPIIAFNLTSDDWAHRKEGLEKLQASIEASQGAKQELMQEAINAEVKTMSYFLRKLLQDRVAPVYFAAFDCFRAMLKVYGSLINHDLEQCLTSLLPPLVNAMGGEATGTNRRTQREACRCILRVARLTTISGLKLVCPLLSCDDIALRPRLALLKLIIQEFQFDGKATSLEGTMSICKPALGHADDKVRKAACAVVVAVYEIVGKHVKPFLVDIKPALQKSLEKKFAEIDGSKPVERSQREVKETKGLPQLAPVRGARLSAVQFSSTGDLRASIESDSSLDRAGSAPLPAQSPKISNQQWDGFEKENADSLMSVKRRLLFDSSTSGDYGNGGNKFQEKSVLPELRDSQKSKLLASRSINASIDSFEDCRFDYRHCLSNDEEMELNSILQRD